MQAFIDPLDEALIDPLNEALIVPSNETLVDSLNEVFVDPLDETLVDPAIVPYQTNPFYLPLTGSTLKFSKTYDIAKKYDRLLILCLNEMTYQQNEIKKIFNRDTSIEDLVECSGLLTVVQCPVSIINCGNVREGLLEVNSKALSIFSELSLNDTELVYLMVDSLKDDVLSWIKLYATHDYFGKYLHQKRFYMFNKLSDPQIHRELINLIMNISENSFWDNLQNCGLSDNKSFYKRKFNSSGNCLLVNTTSTYADTLENLPMNNKIYRKGFFPITKCEQLNYHSKSMTEIMCDIKMSKKETYYLFCNLLLHKDYCHLVLQNASLLEASKELFTQFAPIFRYVMSYAWLTLLKEENATKTKITLSDRFVFDINTASNLPSYYFNPTETHLNPYTTLCLSKSVMNCQQGIMGVKNIENYTMGIVKLNEFKMRFNTFTTGRADMNIFDGIDWSHMMVTGGVMAATLPLANPLMFHPQFTCINNFYDEYYSTSDVDVACKFDTMMEYVDHVVTIRDTIKMNLLRIHSNVEMNVIPDKSLAIFINQTLLKEKCARNEAPFKFEYIMDNLKKQDVKYYFYKMYLQQKVQSDENLGEKIYDDIHFNIIKMVDINHVTLIINDVFYKCPESGKVTVSFKIYENDTCYIRFTENLKFKIISKQMKHNVEVFMVNDFIKAVSRFHLPCVRSYYDGNTVMMTASAVSAYMTLTNVDVKYFVGKHYPVEIINKYRIRGYGFILNNVEIHQMMEYVNNNQEIKKMYGLGPADPIHQIRGVLNLNHALFKPISFITPPAYIHSMKEIYSKKYPACWSELFTTSIIDGCGDVVPFQKWILDAGYPLLNSLVDYEIVN